MPTEMPNYNANKASMGPAFGGTGPGNSDPKPDSFSTCLQRIEANIIDLAVVMDNLNTLADRINGDSPRGVLPVGGLVPTAQMPEPSHILFRAHRVESRLVDHLKSLQDILARFDTYL